MTTSGIGLSLTRLIIKFRNSYCAETFDHVYGLVGLLGFEGRFQIDYSRTTNEFLRYVIEHCAFGMTMRYGETADVAYALAAHLSLQFDCPIWGGKRNKATDAVIQEHLIHDGSDIPVSDLPGEIIEFEIFAEPTWEAMNGEDRYRLIMSGFHPVLP
jgi:hypothetical protein